MTEGEETRHAHQREQMIGGPPDIWPGSENLPQPGSRADSGRCVYCGAWHAVLLEEREEGIACLDREWCAMRARKRRGPNAAVPRESP